MTQDELKQAADEMVEMFGPYMAISHCERVIGVLMDVHSQMWGMEDAIRVTANEINTHRLILSELEGRVK